MSAWTCTPPRPGALLYTSGPLDVLADAAGVSLAMWGKRGARGLRITTIDDLLRVEREVVERIAESAREGVRVTLREAFEHYVGEAVGCALLGVEARASLAEVEQWV